MAVLTYYNFESSSSIPSTLNADTGQLIDAGSAIFGGSTNSFVNNSGASKNSLSTTQDPLTGNLILSARIKVLNPIGAGSNFTLIGRCSDANPANFLTTASSLRVAIPLGTTQSGIGIYRRNGGTQYTLSNLTLVGNPFLAGETYQPIFTLSGTSLKVEIQCLTGANAGLWFKPDGATWQSSRVACVSVTDSTSIGGTLLSGAGFWGWRIGSETGTPNSSVFVDEVRLASSAAVSVSPSSPSIVPGGTSNLTATNFPGGSWSSSNPGIATVNSSTGVVTGVSVGSCNITFTSSVDPSESATAVVTVTAGSNATGYTLTCSPASVPVGSPVTVTATITGGSTLSAPLVITLSDSLGSTIGGAITINNGSTTGTASVTPSAPGTHSITASHSGGGFAGGDGSASFTATGPVTIAANDSNWVDTPGNVDVRSSSSAVMANWGAGRSIGFTGTSCVANFSLARLTAANIPLAQYPKIAYSIDNGAWQTAQAAASVTLATGLAAGTHSLQIVLANAVASSDAALTTIYDRWVNPDSAVYLTSLTVDSGAASAAVPSFLAARPRRALFFGNSMTAGTITIAPGSYLIDSNDGRYTWAAVVGEALNMDVGNCAWPGQSYPGPATGGVPKFFDPATPANSTYRFISQGRPRSFTGITDVFFAHGVIESTDPSSNVIAALTNMRSLLPAGAKMWQLIPFGGHWRAEITAAVNSYKATSGDTLCYVIDLGTTAQTGLAMTGSAASGSTKQSYDNYHPNAERQAQLGAMAAKAIQAIEATGPTATSFSILGIPAAPVVGTTYNVAVILNNPAADNGTATFGSTTGITWGGPVAIAAGAVSGSTTVTFNAAGNYTPTVTHSGWTGVSANPTLSPVTAAAPAGTPAATTYALDFGSAAPVVGQYYKVTARLPIGTNLAANVTVNLAGTNLRYSATQGGTPASTGSLTIDQTTGTGVAYWSPTAAGTVSPSATNGSSLTNPTIATLTASTVPATQASGYGLYFPPIVAGTPSQGIAFLTGGVPLGSDLVIVPSGSGVTLPGTITILAGQVSVTFPFTVTQPGPVSVSATHTGAPSLADPAPIPITASSASASGLGGLVPSGTPFANLLKGGLSSVLDAVVAANPSLSPSAIAQIHDASGGSLNQAYRGLSQLVDSYIHGDPITLSEANGRFADYVSVFTSVAQATSEVAAMVKASPGVLKNGSSTNGNVPVLTRKFS
ncbi:beta strand repeat-containing protein [Tundrisphaera lichenicola]|uniref:beta strand repeat-containing protein n=1 Tax=Tundrisphaera lichenicola TaxID=2029860 RepID=UPI003EBD8558